MSAERTRLTLEKFTEILESDFDKALSSGPTKTACDDYDVLADELESAANKLRELVRAAKRRDEHFWRGRSGRPWKAL